MTLAAWLFIVAAALIGCGLIVVGNNWDRWRKP